MASPRLESWYARLARLSTASSLAAWTVLRNVLTLSYAGALSHYTIQPLDRIRRRQHDVAEVAMLLAEFRDMKQEELGFVNQGLKSALAFAAVIGVFSWPDVATSFWPCTVFWRTSLFLSLFALISSGQQSLMDQLPQSKTETSSMSEDHVRALLLLALRNPMRKKAPGINIASSSSPVIDEMVDSPALRWVWQTKMMQMSFAWLAFLQGLFFYLLTPLLGEAVELRPAGTERKAAIIPIVVGIVALLNFLICAGIVHSSITDLRSALAEP